ncbi:uncharacterized protein LOC134837941 [Culicoides brevitarsis]|uniref:uncharacterized protein LOC134837941 n=1 Tax=Culicoides brevitarsis TaxID=469753 RepID=UPI00307B6B47
MKQKLSFGLCWLLILTLDAAIGLPQPRDDRLRNFPRTKFSCVGRPAGYYADIETGCQLYHMCDGQGRQFTNICPNATLFQQRMLICDHWYMVDCDRAESNYDANLLIGQRDLPFVTEEERFHEIRTPRPDILDRPYAPDYSGESFRKNFKNPFPSPQNSIDPIPQLRQPKPFSVPNQDIFLESESSHGAKPVHVQASNIIDDIKKTIKENNVEQTLTTAESRTDSKGLTSVTSENPKAIVPPSKYYSPPFLEPIYNREYTEENNKIARTPADQSTRRTYPTTTKSPYDKYDFSAFDSILKAVRKGNREDYDFSKYIRNKDGTLTPRRTTQSKVMSKNSGFQATTKKNNLFAVTQAPVRSTQTKQRPPIIQNPSGFVQSTVLPTTTTQRTTTRASTTTTRKPISTTTTRRSTTRRPVSTTIRAIVAKPQLSSISAPSLNIIPPISEPRPFAQQNNKVTSISKGSVSSASKPIVPPLALELLPPFEKETYHDVATTLGPPIYYEWKSQVPASELLPPFEANPENADNFGAHSQATRSVSGQTTILLESALEKLIKSNWTELRNIHAIPEFNFPLEREELRTGYDNNERVNSFQLKIPDKSLQGKEWYGENPKCPECHPSFLKPGLCSPCIKIRE